MSSDPPVPKPRSRYKRDGGSALLSQSSAERDLIGEKLEPALANGRDKDHPSASPLNGSASEVFYPSLASVTNIISANIPALAGVSSSIAGSASTPANPSPGPPALDHITSNIATHIPWLSGVAGDVAYPVATPAMLSPNTTTTFPYSVTSTPAMLSPDTTTTFPYSVTSTPAMLSPNTTTMFPYSVTSTPNVARLDHIVSSLGTHIPGIVEMAGYVPDPATTMPPSTTTGPKSVSASAPSLDSAVATNIANIAGLVSAVCKPDQSTSVRMRSLSTTSSADSRQAPSLPEALDGFTDMEALSQWVMATLDRSIHEAAVTPLPPPESATRQGHPTEEGEGPYITMLSNWSSQEETESSNEEEDVGVVPASPGAEEPMVGEQRRVPAPSPTSSTNGVSGHVGVTPCRPAPPPPPMKNQSRDQGKPLNQSRDQGKPLKEKTPRAATIRVSRKKKGGAAGSSPRQSEPDGHRQNAAARSGWLDVWKGFRHNVLWATLDGQLMSLWKKRTDKFSEVVFHVSSITNVKKQDKGRFSVYFRKKHYDFMAHNDMVQEDWVTSLQACRGQASPSPPEFHGPITTKDPRSRVYAAIWGHNLWLYHNKEDYQLGVGMLYVSMTVAAVKQTGKHGFSLITPYKTFNCSVDSSKDLPVWLSYLSSTIRSALSCSQVALRLWESPSNKVCADCGSANPEWASVNLLVVICEACASQHRALGSSVSKVRSLKLDNKVWTEPLIQLFIRYGNRVANEIWSPAVPATEQLCPESSDEDRAEFIRSKYARGRYRRLHPLASSQRLLDERLCEVVCGDSIAETMSLLCSGAKVLCFAGDPQCPSPISLAERAGQALQTELLRHNEYTEAPAYLPQSANRGPDSALSGYEEEALHGKLEEDRFLFSLENDSAACDVLDLREVVSVFLLDGPSHEFELVTLTDRLICAADTQETLLCHLVHILKVIVPGCISEADLMCSLAVSRVCVMRVGGALEHSETWAVLQRGGVTVYPAQSHAQQTLRLTLDKQTHSEMNPFENTIELVTGERTLLLRFEEAHSCLSWYTHLTRAVANHSPAPQRRSLYQLMPSGTVGSVPPAIERCISHITQHGLKVEGIYRRCGFVTKVNRLVEALVTSPSSAPLERDELGVLDAASALKQYVRQQAFLIPLQDRELWAKAAALPDERTRLAAYRRLLRQLPNDNRATLSALCGHFYMVQIFSSENRMTAHNLALVLVPTLFQELAMNKDLVRLTRELIIYHTLVFLSPEEEEREGDSEEQITFL